MSTKSTISSLTGTARRVGVLVGVVAGLSVGLVPSAAIALDTQPMAGGCDDCYGLNPQPLPPGPGPGGQTDLNPQPLPPSDLSSY